MLATARLSGLCRLASTIALCALLFGCGGGGGGGGGGSTGSSFTASPGALNFSALANAATPLPQAVTVTVSGVSSNALFFRVTIPGGLVASVSSVSITGANTGQAFVTVVAPTTLPTGTHNGTISIVACTTDINCTGPLLGGSPQAIAVTYTIAPTLQGDAVAPRVVTSGVPGEVVLRGTGLAALTSVAFNGVAATGFTQLGATEVRASYPVLSAGTLPVQLQNAAGPVAFSGNLVVVNPPAFSAATLPYPSSPGNFRSLVYDAARQAILVATDTRILRYAFVGSAWQAPTQQAITSLRDTVLSNNGASLLALTTDSLRELDPVTLVQNGITNGPVSGPSPVPLNRLALANDGIAVVTAEQFDTYLYPTGSPSFFRAALSGASFFFGALPAASENRSLIAFIQGQLSPAPEALKYVSSSGLLSATGLHENRISVNIADIDPAPTVDRSGTRIAFTSSVGDTSGGTHVYDENMSVLGALPLSTQSVAFAPNPAGASVRAYTLDACKLRAFDLLTVNSGNFAEITAGGYPVTLNGCTGNHPKIVMTPDGGNAILAGDTQVVIVQTP